MSVQKSLAYSNKKNDFCLQFFEKNHIFELRINPI